MAGKKYKVVKLWSKVFILTLLLVFIIQTFFIQSFYVSSTSMESSIKKGDKVWVNKMAYGIRLPVTLLAIPFVYNEIFGMKSYVNLGILSYHRLFSKKVKANDIVLFNNPLDKKRPLDKRDLLISRCIATPGDTLIINNSEVIVNGKSKPLSPDMMSTYKTDKLTFLKIDSIFNIHDAVVEEESTIGDSITIRLSRYHAYLINTNLPDKNKLLPDISSNKLYNIILPHKNLTIELNRSSILYFSDIIMAENPKITLDFNNLVLNENILKEYTFKYNYYWFLSDNPQIALDSQTFGFVSEQDIIGKVFYISRKEKI